ncbi:MAG: bifunctional glutamate N-acetyltransferase/amino-acid acetyltransferase ArgJ [Rubripirellula sp.]|nr:bifunctional glutamate N-acetyltransferase/amino-acid acetyltransferase ArgJ [Rubripirellula sp.]
MTHPDNISECNDSISEESLPRGFRFSGTACGLKASGKKDMSLLVADQPVVASGVYTQNQIVAAPVLNCRSKTPSASIRAVVANSGNANACTGQQGDQDASEMCTILSEKLDCLPEQILVMSTGVIGVHLNMSKVQEGIQDAFAMLDDSPESFLMAADAICTTDQSRKVAARSIQCSNGTIRIAGMAKGAGMIAPNMATMLSVIFTDAKLSPEQAQSMLKIACDTSFNRISVDGHTSTNDTVLLLASGACDVELDEPLANDFQQELNQLLRQLAKLIVLDGEGAKHIMAIEVVGAVNDDQAFEIAKTVAASPLVKTAITGGDPNWGRIVSAAGYAHAKMDPTNTALTICGETIYRDGTPVKFNAGELSGKMKSNREVSILLQVGLGEGKANYWSSDLTTAYVEFNSEYTT